MAMHAHAEYIRDTEPLRFRKVYKNYRKRNDECDDRNQGYQAGNRCSSNNNKYAEGINVAAGSLYDKWYK